MRRSFFIMILVLMGFGVPATVSGQVKSPKTAAEAKKEEAAVKKDIQQTEARLKENDTKVRKGLSELGKLDIEIEKTTAEIKGLEGKVGKLGGEIKNLEVQINKNEKELAKLRDEYLKAVKKMRITKKNRSTLAFIFSSNSVSQAMRRMRYLKEFSAWRGRQTDEIKGKIADLSNQKDALAKARDEQERTLAVLKTDKTKLAEQHSRQEVLVAELKQNGEALQAHLQRKQAEARDLGNKVSQLIAAEQKKAEEERRRQEETARKEAEEKRKAEERQRAEEQRLEAERRKAEEEKLLAKESTSGGENAGTPSKTEPKEKQPKKAPEEKPKSSTSTAYADARKRAPRASSGSGTANTSGSTGSTVKTETAASFPDMKGKLPRPSSGSFTVTSRFGRQQLPDLPGVEFDNPGIDAETDAGSTARAVFKGQVSGVYLLPGYNTVVIVNHGDYYTVYGNISSPSVKIGDKVDTGSNLGQLALSEDDNGRSSIHFEVWKNREKLNPLEWLR